MPFSAGSAYFDGVNDYMSRGAGLDGAADSKLVAGAFWVKPDAPSPTARYFLGTDVATGGLVINQPGTFGDATITGYNSTGTNILNARGTSANPLPADEWTCVMFSFDMANTGKRHLYYNNVSVDAGVVHLNAALDFTRSDWFVGSRNGGADKLAGSIAEFWLAAGQYIDFSVEANRRKFYKNGRPADLGSDGSTPTGTAPIIYFHLDEGEAVASFATNRGTGGNFSITGTLEAGPSPARAVMHTGFAHLFKRERQVD